MIAERYYRRFLAWCPKITLRKSIGEQGKASRSTPTPSAPTPIPENMGYSVDGGSLKCPLCGRKAASDSSYCRYCGARLKISKPVQLPSVLRGNSVIGKAYELFIQNLVLCVPGILEPILVFVLSLLAVAIAFFVGGVYPSSEQQIGYAVGIFFAGIISLVPNFMYAWLTTASFQILRIGEAKITGFAFYMVKRKAARIFFVWLVILLWSSPFTAVSLIWNTDTTALNLVQPTLTAFSVVRQIYSMLISVLFIFFMPIIMLTDQSVWNSFKSSISLTGSTLKKDPSYILSILAVNMLIMPLPYIPVFSGLLPLIIGIVWPPIQILSAILYLQINSDAIPKEARVTLVKPSKINKKAESPVANLYNQLLRYYSFTISSQPKNYLENELKKLVKLGLNREEAIRQLAFKEKIIEE